VQSVASNITKSSLFALSTIISVARTSESEISNEILNSYNVDRVVNALAVNFANTGTGDLH
jgi:hypothetical protein